MQPSKSNCGNGKIIFVLGSYEYLERWEGKTKDGIFFVLINQMITVCKADSRLKELAVLRCILWDCPNSANNAGFPLGFMGSYLQR